MKTILSLIISAALVVSGYSQTRNVLVGTNNAVVQPTNFWSADASNARSGLGLGSAATNSASAFQPSSATLSNLATGNGAGLTNISATIVGTNISITNVVGLQSALDGKLATNGSATNLTSFPSVVLQTNSSLSLFPSGLLRTNGDGSGLTNLSVPAFASNILSTVTIAKGGTGATNAEGARTALGGTVVGTNLFTAIDAAAARTAIGLGTASTSASTAFQPSSSALTNLANNNGGSLTNIVSGNIVGTVGLASNISGSVALASNVSGVLGVVNGGTGGTNAQTARDGIGIGTTNTLTIAGVVAQNLTIQSGGGITLQSSLSNAGSFRTNIGLPFVGLTSADAPTFRTALGLGTAATNLENAFQAASGNLTPLAANNGGALTNLQSTSIVGIIPASNISTVNFSNLGGTLTIASGGTGATNAINARANLGSTTVGDALFIATNPASARTTIGATTVGSSVFTLANPSAITFLRLNADNTASALSAADFRTALSLGTASTNLSSAFQPASTVLSNLASNNGSSLTNISVTNVVGALATNGNGFALTSLNASNITGIIPASNVSSVTFSNLAGTLSIESGGTAATNAGGARTNLGLGLPALTNTNATNFRSAIGLGDTNTVLFDRLVLGGENSSRLAASPPPPTIFWPTNSFGPYEFYAPVASVDLMDVGGYIFTGATNGNSLAMYGNFSLYGDLKFGFASNAATSRTNLGLGWSALTNTNTSGFNTSLYGGGTNPVLVSTSGVVVSPTNFWQVAPIQTLVQDFTLIGGTQTNNATNARNLYVYSLNTNLSGVSNTILLPTNAATFAGDEVTVVHQGTTNTTTVVRQAGSTNNLITLNRFDEAVKFIRESGQWDFYHNISFVEPIQFSGTNASNNIAATRTNLGLGATWLTNTNVNSFRTAINLGTNNDPRFAGLMITNVPSGSDFVSITPAGVIVSDGTTNSTGIAFGEVYFSGPAAAATTRTNLGLGLPALTNSNTTNFQAAVFQTNTAPVSGGTFGAHAAWMEVNVITNGSNVSFRIPLYK